MKKKQIIMLTFTLIAIVCLFIISFYVGTDESNDSTKIYENANEIYNNALKESNTIEENEKKEFLEIDVDKYLEYYSGTEVKLVLIARPTCSACQIAEPILQNIAYKYDLDISYLNTDDFDEEAETKLIQSNEYYSNGFGTPLLLVLKDSSIVNKVEGVTDNYHYEEFLRNNSFIK